MIMQTLRAYKNFKQNNDVVRKDETLVARAVRAGWDEAQEDNNRHRRVRRNFRGIISRRADESELPY